MFYKALNQWNYGELEVEEIGTGKRYTLTQRHTIANEDSFCIYRTVSVPHQGNEDYGYIYQFSYFGKGTGTTCFVSIVDEETAIKIIQEHTKEYLQGHGFDYVLYDIFNVNN